MPNYFDENVYEVELNFLVSDSDVFKKLEAQAVIAGFKLESKEVLSIDDLYFDSENYDLLRDFLCYRIRKQNDRYIIAYKKHLGLGEHGEHINEEVEVDLAEADVVVAKALQFENKAFDLVKKVLDPKLLTKNIAVKNTRTILNFKDEAGQHIEVALDDFDIMVAGEPEHEMEIEIEFKGTTKEQFDAFIAGMKDIIGSVEPVKYAKLSRALLRAGVNLDELKKVK